MDALLPLRRLLLAAGIAGLLVATWLAAPGARATASTPGADTSRAAQFKVDPVHSAAVFEIEWQGMTPFYGQFNDFSGTVSYDGKNPGSFSCDVSIPVESIDTHNAQRDGHLKSPDFFNAREYPSINFKSKSLTDNGDGTWTAKGDLTMRGQTKPIEAKLSKLAVVEGQRGTRCGFSTEFIVKRTDWGVSFGAGQGLGEDVRLMVSIQSAAE